MRLGKITRVTKETNIQVELIVDGKGLSRISTGVGFFDHMLTAFAKHGFFDLKVDAEGDLEVDAHHTVEDVGIVLGQALAEALGDKTAITRFGTALVPMDEALMMASIDISGRPYLALDWDLPNEMLGTFPTVLGEEFFRAFAFNAGMTLHIRQLAGRNAHHILEAAFKAVARALALACAVDDRIEGILSTKGFLA
ncbi:MAG: imidazoleglycerol-phosphate dehydratase HisB [Firmicutes bacterium]|nr:imidazoleglycerol-phosphate dehydratase HisB [Bacillota bacterium]